MTEDLRVLLIQLQDELNRLFVLQQLLKIALEQLSNPDDDTVDRLDLLISLYLPQAEHHFDELRSVTDQIRRLLREELSN